MSPKVLPTRPKKNIHQFYSGKKKKHTLKSQVVVNQQTGEIICTAHGKGKEHDFRVFKNSKSSMRKDIKCLADKGYQGIQKQHPKSWIPHKKPRGGELTIEAKKENRQLASLRVVGEHVNRQLKILRF